MIIYEVNLTISTKIYPQFKSWLNPHINEMLNFDGFIKYSIYNILEDSEDYNSISIHYYIQSMEHLNDYLSNNAYIMRKKAIKEFGDSFTVTRRTLSLGN